MWLGFHGSRRGRERLVVWGLEMNLWRSPQSHALLSPSRAQSSRLERRGGEGGGHWPRWSHRWSCRWSRRWLPCSEAQPHRPGPFPGSRAPQLIRPHG